MANWHKSFIEALIDNISQEYSLSRDDFYGCTEAELRHMMNVFRVRHLPEIYRQFMLKMGHGFASRDDDMMWTYPEVLEFENSLRKLDQENVFVFMWHNIHQVIFYCFSTTDLSDDPPVLTWNEDMSDLQWQPYAESLSQFLTNFFAPE